MFILLEENEQVEPINTLLLKQEDVKLCIKGLNDSLSNVMKSDIMSLLDHVAFEIKTINEK